MKRSTVLILSGVVILAGVSALFAMSKFGNREITPAPAGPSYQISKDQNSNIKSAQGAMKNNSAASSAISTQNNSTETGVSGALPGNGGRKTTKVMRSINVIRSISADSFVVESDSVNYTIFVRPDTLIQDSAGKKILFSDLKAGDNILFSVDATTDFTAHPVANWIKVSDALIFRNGAQSKITGMVIQQLSDDSFIMAGPDGVSRSRYTVIMNAQTLTTGSRGVPIAHKYASTYGERVTVYYQVININNSTIQATKVTRDTLNLTGDAP